MFKIIKSKKPFKDEIGDILYGEEYFEEFKKEDLEGKDVVPLRFSNALNPWKVLRHFHVDPSLFQSHVEYPCPFLGRTFYWAVPTYILTKDIKQYYTDTVPSRIFENDWEFLRKIGHDDLKYYQECRSSSFLKSYQSDKHILGIPRVTDVLLGLGYTEGTLPSDGHGSVKEAKVNLDNGDIIIVKLWVWYNK